MNKQQIETDKWVGNHGGYWPITTMLAHLLEEAGELAQAINHSENKGKVADEMADVIFVTCCMANQLGINLKEAFDIKMKTRGRTSEALR